MFLVRSPNEALSFLGSPPLRELVCGSEARLLGGICRCQGSPPSSPGVPRYIFYFVIFLFGGLTCPWGRLLEGNGCCIAVHSSIGVYSFRTIHEYQLRLRGTTLLALKGAQLAYALYRFARQLMAVDSPRDRRLVHWRNADVPISFACFCEPRMF